MRRYQCRLQPSPHLTHEQALRRHRTQARILRNDGPGSGEVLDEDDVGQQTRQRRRHLRNEDQVIQQPLGPLRQIRVEAPACAGVGHGDVDKRRAACLRHVSHDVLAHRTRLRLSKRSQGRSNGSLVPCGDEIR